MCYYIWSISVAFPYFLHFYVHPFHRHLLFPFLWHLVCPSISYRLPLYPKSLELESWNFDTMFTTPCVWRVTCHVSHIAIHILAVTCPDLEKNIFCELWNFGNTDLAEKASKLRQIWNHDKTAWINNLTHVPSFLPFDRC